MAIKAIVFDIGGVLEITPPTGWQQKWEGLLELSSGQLRGKMYDTWRAGSIGTITLDQVHEQTASVLNISTEQVVLLMDDLWTEYLGSLNTELYDYFKSLRPKYTTAILSNSFVGAREKEQEHYGFENSCDTIIYSHEVGMAKPDPRIYALTCEQLKLEPYEIIFVDDVKVIIEAAVKFGLHGVLFESNRQTISSIESLVAQEGA